jgi:hypothetical protein
MLRRESPDLAIGELRHSRHGPALLEHLGSLEHALEKAAIRDWPTRLGRPVPDRRTTLRTIRARHRSGHCMRESALRNEDYPFLHAGRRHFQTWSNALRAAGVPNDSPACPSRVDRGRCDRGAPRPAADGLPMNPAAIWRDQPGLARAAARFFGSVLAAAEPLGGRPALEHWDKGRIVAELQALAASRVRLTLGGIAAARGAKWRNSLLNAANRHFGNFSRARIAASVTGPPRQRWDRDVIVAELQALAESGVRLTADGIAAACGTKWRDNLVHAVRRHFGGLPMARNAAFPPAGRGKDG